MTNELNDFIKASLDSIMELPLRPLEQTFATVRQDLIAYANTQGRPEVVMLLINSNSALASNCYTVNLNPENSTI